MNIELMEFITHSVVLGVGATIVMDFWALMLQRITGLAPFNYALLGRWLAHMNKGVFRHNTIATAKPIKVELVIGWAVHYLIGVVFAAVLIMFMGNEWARAPTVTPAVAFGTLSVVLPFFFMQPFLGFGIAASKNPKPNIARFRSLLTHFIFGVGLYISATLNSIFLMN